EPHRTAHHRDDEAPRGDERELHPPDASGVFSLLLELLAVFAEPLAEEPLALVGAFAAVLLHAAEERRELLVSIALRVLCVLVESPDVLEAEVRDGDEVVVLVLRPAFR